MGNIYGNVTAGGRSKVLMANVVDEHTNPYMVRRQQFGNIHIGGSAKAMMNDVDRQAMNDFFGGGTSRRRR